MSSWDVVYKSAENEDGSLLFPERLSKEFLTEARKAMGSYIYANQYLNKIIPDDLQTFKREWLRYIKEIPEKTLTFAFIDPALSQSDTACFTGVTVVKVDSDDNWYVVHAHRKRYTPTQIIDLCFHIQTAYKCHTIGIETIAYQEALMYMLDTEMRKRSAMLPVVGIKHGAGERKETRILSLVPRFEWSRLFLARGLLELEDELMTFPRGAYVDILDSLASIEKIYLKPEKEKPKDERPNPADAENYERWYRSQLSKNQGRVSRQSDENEYD